MPCHRNPNPLLQQTSIRLAEIISATILDVKKVKALNGYLETLPSQLVEQVLDTSIRLYTRQCRRQENVATLEVVQFGCSDRLLPSLPALIENQVTPSMTRLDFTYLIHLGTLSANAFACFHQILEHCLRKTGNNLTTLNLKSPNSRTSLPFVNSAHFSILSAHCPKLCYFDCSFVMGLKNEDLLDLSSGCPLLQFLYIYDCGFSDKYVKSVALTLTHLKELGYKEMGSVLKRIAKENPETVLRFKHVNHLGGRMRKTSVSSLRFKRSLSEATAKVCSQVTNLKVRVQDSDVEGLINLKNLTSVELLYNVGRPTTPALGTASFLQSRGQNLTSVALICSAISMVHIKLLGQSCPYLRSLWLRSNHFQVTKGGRCEEVPEEFLPTHNYFKNLQTLYFRVGEGELALSFVPNYVLHYLLKNAGLGLRELIIALRCYFMDDKYLCDLLIQRNLQALKKLIICVPGLNNLNAVIPLTMKSVNFVLDFCQGIKTMGNLLSWTLNKEEFEICQLSLESNNYDIELICRHTKFN